MNTNVDTYFTDGCMRCDLGGTPNCKVHLWTAELELLRKLVLDCGLTEESKWGVPCYTHKNSNVLIVSAFKNYCSISFFKGALLKDESDILEKPGEHSQAARLFKFTDIESIQKREALIKAYVFEAIEIEKAGLKVAFKKNPEPIPVELQEKLDEDPVFKTAFDALTPGRKRGYILHFSQPKQAKTRRARIEKYTRQILNGEGMHDAYRSKRKNGI